MGTEENPRSERRHAMHRDVRIMIVALLGSAFLPGCGNDGSSPSGDTARAAASTQTIPQFPSDPDEFVAGIDNPYLGFKPGRVFHYAGQTDEGLETNVVEVTKKKKTILGIAVTVIHDQAFLDGELVEDTFDWFAQDKDGNVWYFGEDSKELEDGQVVSTFGSWEAGVDGAVPGIIMLAKPKVGLQYQQEFFEGVAEDNAKVLSLSEKVVVPFGTFSGCLKTVEWTPLEPGAREFKFNAPGIGLVLVQSNRGGPSVMELTAIED
jgi:hypothetical protein